MYVNLLLFRLQMGNGKACNQTQSLLATRFPYTEGYLCYNFSWHNIGYDFDCILYQYRFLNGQTLCLNKVIVGRTSAKNAWKMSDVQP